MNNTLTIKISASEADKLRGDLGAKGLKERASSSEYIAFSMQGGGATVTYYTSGKLVVQGEGDLNALVSSKGGSESAVSKGGTNFVPHIGVDESGKGDYFGPLVAAAVYVSNENLAVLKEVGVTDSKKLSPEKISEIAAKIYEICRFKYIALHPEHYNEEIAAVGNIGIVLAKLHSQVIEELLTELKVNEIECSEVVIDQFSKNEGRVRNLLGPLGSAVGFKQFHGGESDIAVAAASIVARDRFVTEFREMSDRWGIGFHKGATIVIPDGKEFIKKHGAENLKYVAKLHFKTTMAVL